MISEEKFDQLSSNIKYISHGDSRNPMGFEALVMALCGSGTPGESNILSALSSQSDYQRQIAEAIDNLACAMHRIAKVMEDK